MRYHPRMLSRPIASTSRLVRIALLWLALVLAVAQVVAVRHVYSHAPGESSSQSGSKHSGEGYVVQSCVREVLRILADRQER